MDLYIALFPSQQFFSHLNPPTSNNGYLACIAPAKSLAASSSVTKDYHTN